MVHVLVVHHSMMGHTREQRSGSWKGFARYQMCDARPNRWRLTA